MEEFDEMRAIAHMRELTSGIDGCDYSDDELLNVIDIIFDYYEDAGMLDIDGDDDLDVGELVSHVAKMIAKDKLSPISVNHIEPLVLAELDYEQQIADSL